MPRDSPRAGSPSLQSSAGLANAARARPINLDTISVHWRVALNTAQEALQAARNCESSLKFPEAELSEHSQRLADERKTVAQLLDQIALQERVPIQHRVLAPHATKRMLGLSPEVLACVFDLDGVLTASAGIHAAAWEETFDEFLSHRVESTGERFAPFKPFNRDADYFKHINGKPRIEGVHAFLASRGIRLPEGDPEDPPEAGTVSGLANHKNVILMRHLEREGVAAFVGSQQYLEEAREAGLRCAVVSASTNTDEILERAGLASLIDERVDGNTIRAEHLQSKPAPDTLLAACRRLGVEPHQAAAFETTLAGVAAARSAGFDLVIGVDRRGRAAMRPPNGADLVVTDLRALLNPALRVR